MRKTYIRSSFYRDRKSALKEAARLRKTGRYAARVAKTNIPHHYPYTIWTKLLSNRP